MVTSPLSLQPDYPGGDEGGAAVPRGAPRCAGWEPEPWPVYTLSLTDGGRKILLVTYMRHTDKSRVPSVVKTIQGYFASHVAPALADIGYTIKKPPFVSDGVGEKNPSDPEFGGLHVYFYLHNASENLLRDTVNQAFDGLNQGPLVKAASRVASRHLAGFSPSASSRNADMDANPLDGLKKQKVLNTINAILGRHTKGQFRDNVWAPIQAIRKGLGDANIALEALDGSGRYEKENGVDVRKVWRYKVPFLNQSGRADAVYVSITASGSGPVNDPLAVYDVVAYAS